MKNKLLKKVMLPCLFLIGSVVYAQTVSGVVSDASGPIPGVNVLVKGTTTGTQTDFDGNYSLDVSTPDAVLVFSFLGYATQEIPVNGQTTINVTMSEDIAQLNEVVVVGYGSTTKKEITSSVTKVDEAEFNQGTIN
ncbi:MAG TPA: carboxypeptidase-like regulatory domain-containing protein, partial [Flavobacteriaceae bacterium]|nr:carboxypeptidase-like regulatory domain-containing protein [Flavobacteriaceae bacterium]